MMNDLETGPRGLSARAVTAIALAVLLGVGAASRSARADVVMPPPDECPDGTTPATGHCGPHCEPIACESTADCAEGSCTSVRVCVETLVCAGQVEPDADLSQYERPSVLETCESGTCAQGECQTLKICTTGSGPTSISTGGAAATGSSNSDSGGCSCNLGGESSRSFSLFGLALCATLLGLARRQRLGPRR
jgi:hypothetical protein